MLKSKVGMLAVAWLLLLCGYNVLGQCGVGLPAVDRYCNKQNVVYELAPNANEKYHWYYKDTLTGLDVDYGYANTYVSPYKYPYKDTPGNKQADSMGMLIYTKYQKEVTLGPTPSIPASFSSTPSTVGSLSMTLGSTTDYVLNKITLVVFSYYINPTGNYNFTVALDDNIGATANSSKSFTIAGSTAVGGKIGTSNFYAITLDLGFDVKAASNQVLTVNDANGLGVFNLGTASTDLLSNYSLSSGAENLTLNYGTNKPGIFNYDVTFKCPIQTVQAQYEFDPSKCCFDGKPQGLGIGASTGYTFANSKGETTILLAAPIATTLRAIGISDTSYFKWTYNASAAGSGKGVDELNANATGTYTLQASSKVAFINDPNCYSTSKVVIDEKLLKIIKPSDTVCVGSTIQLSAQNAALNTQWLPTTGFKNNTGNPNNFSPASVQKYVVTVKSTVVKDNKISNGNFSNAAGTLGQGTAYTVSADLNNDGRLNIINSTSATNNNQLAKCPDHTSNSKTDNYLAVNAANSGTGNEYDRQVWGQTVSVTAGQTYTFSSFIANLNKKADPASPTTGNNDDTYDASFKVSNIKYYINYGSGFVPMFATAVPTNGAICNWKEVSQSWTAPATGNVTLRIVETSAGYAAGNEFAIDDISFGILSEQQDTVSIKAKNCLKLDASGMCHDDTLATLYANIQNGFIDKWRNISASQTSTIYNPIEDSTKVRLRNNELSYEVTAYVPAANQIINGDFEDGNVGFNTSYSFGTTSLGPGGYIITKKVTDVVDNKQYYAPIVDHTYNDGTGNMMVIDQQEMAGTLAWEQSVNVIAGTTYDFQMYFANIMSPFYTTAATRKDTCFSGAKDQSLWSSPLIDTCARKARMELVLDPEAKAGTTVRTLATTKSYDANWYLFRATYTATTTTTIKIQFLDLAPKNTVYSSGGTDFAIDDISFTPRTNITLKDTVRLTCVLPVSFINFEGKSLGQQTNLTWSMAHAVSGLFLIEKSYDGIHFSTVGSLTPQANQRHFSYIDFAEGVDANLIYRIKLIEQNGEVSYSRAISIKPSLDEEAFLVPNPVQFGENLNIHLSAYTSDEPLMAEVYEVSAKHLKSTQVFFENGVGTLPTKGLVKGLYLLSINTGDVVVQKKFVVW